MDSYGYRHVCACICNLYCSLTRTVMMDGCHRHVVTISASVHLCVFCFI